MHRIQEQMTSVIEKQRSGSDKHAPDKKKKRTDDKSTNIETKAASIPKRVKAARKVRLSVPRDATKLGSRAPTSFMPQYFKLSAVSHVWSGGLPENGIKSLSL